MTPNSALLTDTYTSPLRARQIAVLPYDLRAYKELGLRLWRAQVWRDAP